MEWISVKDRLPEFTKDDAEKHPDDPMRESDLVLTWNGTYNVTKLFQFSTNEPFFFQGKETTHWMKLTPPKD